MTKQFVVISYDISDDSRRRKIAQTLEDYAGRVQYSVFEARLLPAQIEKLKKLLIPYLQEAQDSIRFYYIGADDVSRIQVIGRGKVTEEKTYFIQ